MEISESCADVETDERDLTTLWLFMHVCSQTQNNKKGNNNRQMHYFCSTLDEDEKSERIDDREKKGTIKNGQPPPHTHTQNAHTDSRCL